ncbi:muscleblind-like protein 1 isoform X2 [Chrysoperla carnea]|uniref:muscleblind-like protein 1 isoform X2 n=1 Tax=Chrysoperla carnea TaxID=189513 RepID=UPI001D070536|nr:muscleblind-like protein 1 isoform X2 [Chrysoperla carnea]
MAMVNMNNLLNGKDSRWLQLEVCREFQRQKCSRPDTECKFAHPPANVEVQNGRVTACYDSIKGRCNREKPPCKYFHPPQHLKDQLLINGRNHLALKNALMQQMGLTPGQPLVPGQVPAVATNPYLSMPQVGSTYTPYFAPGPIMPTLMGPDPSGVASQLSVVPQTVVAQQKMPRSDRLEVCREYQRGACKRAESECRFAHPADTVTANEDGTVTVCMDAVKGRCNRDPCRYFHPPLHLQAHIKAAQSRASAPAAVSPLQAAAGGAPLGHAPPPTAPLELGKKRARDPSTADTELLLMDMKSVGSFYYENFAFPGMVPYKRPAADKSGMPVYQPSATTYQQLMQLQQPFVPVSCEYTTPPPSSTQHQQQQQTPASSSTTAPITSVAVSNSQPNVIPSHANSEQHNNQSQQNAPLAHITRVTQQHNNTLLGANNSISASAVVTNHNNNKTQKDDNDGEIVNNIQQTPTVSVPQAPPPTMPPPPIMADAAAIAKEVAQQNYAKKLAQVNNNQLVMNPLAALNYTGVALNKQTMAAASLPPPPQVPRYTHHHHMPYTTMPQLVHAASFQPSIGLAGSPFPCTVTGTQQGLLQYSRPPPTMNMVNPYSFLRQHIPMAGNPYSQAVAAQASAAQAAAIQQTLINQSILASQLPPYSLANSAPATPTPAAATLAAAAQSNNNNIVMQPYKKMKTT